MSPALSRCRRRGGLHRLPLPVMARESGAATPKGTGPWRTDGSRRKSRSPLSVALLSGMAAFTLVAGPLQAGESGTRFSGGQTPDPAMAASRPADLWSVDVETGALWRVTDNTRLDYTLIPVMVSLRTPAAFRFSPGSGEVTVRHRFTLLAEAVAEGPESAYLGFSASPSIEYWFRKNGPACLYASVGGGFGWTDSTDVPGGQGQDFTLNWFATAGFRYYVNPLFAVNAGAMFQHWSNGGATDPNPGLDAFGPVIGATWHF